VDAITINSGGFTHTGVAIWDVLLGFSRPFAEPHISNVHAHEPFRSRSYQLDKGSAAIYGLATFE